MGDRERTVLTDYLDNQKVSYRLSTHDPVYTSLQAANVRNAPLKSGAKALLFATNDRGFLLVVIRADKRVDTSKLAQAVNSSGIRLAKTKELRRLTRCDPGSVHPFGNLWGVRVVLDRNFDVDEINFNAGTNSDSIHMRFQDYVDLVRPIIVDIAEEQSTP